MKQQDGGEILSTIYNILKVVRDIFEIFLTPLYPIKWLFDKIDDTWGRLDLAFSLIIAIAGIWVMIEIDEPTPPYLIAIYLICLACVIIASSVLLIWMKKLEIKE